MSTIIERWAARQTETNHSSKMNDITRERQRIHFIRNSVFVFHYWPPDTANDYTFTARKGKKREDKNTCKNRRLIARRWNDFRTSQARLVFTYALLRCHLPESESRGATRLHNECHNTHIHFRYHVRCASRAFHCSSDFLPFAYYPRFLREDISAIYFGSNVNQSCEISTSLGAALLFIAIACNDNTHNQTMIHLCDWCTVRQLQYLSPGI